MNNLRELLKALSISFLLLLILSGLAPAQDRSGLQSFGAVYSNGRLSFRYRSPGGMHDETASARAAIQAQAIGHPATKTLDLLLKMSSGSDDMVSTWHSLSIETYPRDALGNLDDADAEAKMTAWVVGLANLPVAPKSVVLSGQSFAVSVLARGDEKGKKGAVVWTTIRNGKLLSFAFVANSPQQLTTLTESMKSIEFF
ncbi:MAG: hypothetical protein WB762_14865 [Candidatus Sulfotelmatobacter sp.]